MTDPIIRRGSVRSVIGVEVDTLDLTLLVTADVTVGAVPMATFARRGGFDGARVEVSRAFYAAHGSTSCGSLPVFAGRVSELTVSGTEIRMAVKSELETLDVQMPRNLYMASCIHTLYGPGCGLSAVALTVTGNVTSGATASSVSCNLAQSGGYFDLGVMRFTSGANAGLTRSIKTYTTGVIVPVVPFPYTPAPGDLFTARPGCDKRETTCDVKFSNHDRFRGYPFIPVAEAAL